MELRSHCLHPFASTSRWHVHATAGYGERNDGKTAAAGRACTPTAAPLLVVGIGQRDAGDFPRDDSSTYVVRLLLGSRPIVRAVQAHPPTEIGQPVVTPAISTCFSPVRFEFLPAG